MATVMRVKVFHGEVRISYRAIRVSQALQIT